MGMIEAAVRAVRSRLSRWFWATPKFDPGQEQKRAAGNALGAEDAAKPLDREVRRPVDDVHIAGAE